MKIFRVTRTDAIDYNEYFSFICVANDIDEALHMKPDLIFDDFKNSWTDDISVLEIDEIGLSNDTFKEPEIILSS